MARQVMELRAIDSAAIDRMLDALRAPRPECGKTTAWGNVPGAVLHALLLAAQLIVTGAAYSLSLMQHISHTMFMNGSTRADRDGDGALGIMDHGCSQRLFASGCR